MADQAVFSTVLSGTLVYVIGQIVLKFFIDPVQELKKTIGAVSHSLIEHLPEILTPGRGTAEIEHETSQEFRKLASQLRSNGVLVPWYRYTALLFGLPAYAEIDKASRALTHLATGVFRDNTGQVTNRPASNRTNVMTICGALRIPDPEQ
jgi:hypothetical protein